MRNPQTSAMLVLCAVIGMAAPVVAVGWLAQQGQVASSKSDKPLPACLPRGVVCELRDFARFNGLEPQLSEHLLDWAWQSFAGH